MDFITRNISDWITAHYDPFYSYVGLGVLVILAATAASWYFPVLRSLAGAVVLGVIAALTGFRKGQQAEDKRQAARDDMGTKAGTSSSDWTDWGSSGDTTPKPPKGGKNQ